MINLQSEILCLIELKKLLKKAQKRGIIICDYEVKKGGRNELHSKQFKI